MLVPYGRASTSVDATLTGNFGLAVPASRYRAAAPTRSTASAISCRSSTCAGTTACTTPWPTSPATSPTGGYDPSRLANLGIGHNAIDAGGGYTYFNPQTGHEFSATLGFTYNFENQHTQYQNGVDMHLDWGASQFLTKQLHVGLVGYAYQQLSCDSGAGDRVGCFESRVFGIGPQIGYIVPISNTYQGYFNAKGYKEFGAEHRPEGWNVWLTFAISPAAPTTPTPRAPMPVKAP